MAEMITRSMYQFKATSYKEEWKDGVGKRVAVGSVEYVGTSTTPTKARAALKAEGIECRRGMHVEIETVGKVLYGMPIDQFFALAQPIEQESEE